MKKSLIVIALLGLGAWLYAAPSFEIDGNTTILRDERGRCVVGLSSAAPASGIVCQDGAPIWRSDTNTWYTRSGTSWVAATFAGQTITGATLTTATVTAPTITTPTITSPVVTGSASSGIVVAKRCSFVEDATNTSYTCSVTIPALAVVEDVQVIGRVLWNGTSASMDCGDTADPNGFFDTINLKAADLVIGEMLSIKHSTLWGGQEGAYLVAASGVRGPTTNNFSMSYVAGSAIKCVITEGATDGTAGRTDMVVLYSTPETVAVTN